MAKETIAIGVCDFCAEPFKDGDKVVFTWQGLQIHEDCYKQCSEEEYGKQNGPLMVIGRNTSATEKEDCLTVRQLIVKLLDFPLDTKVTYYDEYRLVPVLGVTTDTYDDDDMPGYGISDDETVVRLT